MIRTAAHLPALAVAFLLSISPAAAQGYTATAAETDTVARHSSFYLQAAGYSGYVYAHHRSINYLADSYPYGFGLRAGWRFDNPDVDWHNAFRHPRAGAGYMFQSLGGKSFLGYGHALYGYVDIAFLQNRSLEWRYLLGVGAAAVTQHFDVANNNANRVMGSPLNAYLIASTSLEWKAAPSTAIGLGAGLNHMSNGRTSSPNWGLNTFYTMLSVRHDFDHVEFRRPPRPAPDDTPWEMHICLGTGLKQIKPSRDKHYGTGDLHVTVRRRAWRSNAWGFGLGLMYDHSNLDMLRYEKLGYVAPDSVMPLHFHVSLSPCYHASWSMIFGRVTFDIQMGGYFYNVLNKGFFNRWLLEVALTEHISVMGGLKSKLGSADHVEFGLCWFPTGRFQQKFSGVKIE